MDITQEILDKELLYFSSLTWDVLITINYPKLIKAKYENWIDVLAFVLSKSNKSKRTTIKIEFWNLIKMYWINIQHSKYMLGKICPNCGVILQYNFTNHLKECKYSISDWVKLIHNTDSLCKQCNKPLVLHCKQHSYNMFCNTSCKSKYQYIWSNKLTNLSSPMAQAKAAKTVLDKYGTNNRANYWNTNTDWCKAHPQECINHNKKTYKKCLHWQSFTKERKGHKSYLIFKNGITKYMRSSWEIWLPILWDIQNIPFKWEYVKLWSDKHNKTFIIDALRLDTNTLYEIKGYKFINYDYFYMKELVIKNGYKDLIL